MGDPDPNQYNVKEILTLFVMPALNDLREQQSLQARENNTRFERLEQAKNRGMGAIALIVAVLIPISIPVITAALH